MFISILYMFLATTCPSSGKITIYATLGTCHSVWITDCTPDVIHTEWQVPRVAQIQLFLLMMVTQSPETCIEHTKKNYAPSWLYVQDHTGIHGQQNIKKYVFMCMDLRTNSDYFPMQHYLSGFYNRDGVCLLRGTNWILPNIIQV
jgi:hypothetical protein